eukprot:scaffold788_cov56-Attheya_sp.AAC.3
MTRRHGDTPMNKKKQGFEIVNATSTDHNGASGAPSAVTEATETKRSKQAKKVNALRAARSATSSANNKAQAKTQEIWRVKCGAGRVLFADYYRGQGPGVAYPLDQNGRASNSAATSTNKTNPTTGGSRAAKRRRKRKSPGTHSVDNKSSDDGTSVSVAENSEQVTSLKNQDPLAEYLKALDRPLPLAFRIRKHVFLDQLDREKLIKQLELKCSDLVEPVVYSSLLYQSKGSANVTRQTLSSKGVYGTSPLASILTEATSNGLVARQEVVSCLPVMALQVQPGDRVLDLCASPGSKTMQLLESVVTKRYNEDEEGDDGQATYKGRVMANDVNESRLAALSDAVSRSGLPSQLVSRLKYSHADACTYPMKKKLFDKVLTDVPCSGDGTVRKDPLLYKKWNPRTGVALHSLQLKIAWRALHLVKVGGTVCYSTCSLNPVEDEAVVAQLLHHGEGAVELVEWPAHVMPNLIRRPGVRSWRVASLADQDNKDGNESDSSNEREFQLSWHDTYKDALDAGMLDAVPTLWPPVVDSKTGEDQDSKSVDGIREAPEHFHMERCNRIFPQDQDTGGFFVALLRKTRPLNKNGIRV